jgi:hypothetical protein
MKIVEILTFAPTDKATAYDARPLNDPAGLQRISNELAGQEFVIDPMRLNPGVDWPGASVRDTVPVSVASPTIGRDTFGSINAASTNGAMQRGFPEPRRATIPTRR